MTEGKKDLAQIRAQLEDNLVLNASERNTLSKEDLKRYDKLTALLEKMNAGITPHYSDLKRWLNDDYANIAELWQIEKDTRAQFSDVPEELREYELKIKKGLFFEGRRDYYRRRGQFEAASKMDTRAESEFEDALERLGELLTEDASYQNYLDRTVSFEAGSAIGTNPIEIPRLITSRSLDRQGKGLKAHTRRKLDIKIDVVEMVLTEIGRSTREIDVKEQSVQSDKLKKLLDNTGLDDDIWEI